MTTPTRYPDWATNTELSVVGLKNKVDVPTEFKNTGLKAGQPLPRAYLNDQFNLIGLWVRHLEDELGNIVIEPNSAIISQIYPLGSIWMTESIQDPATQLGFGTWAKILGKFLVGHDSSDSSFDVAGEVGGSKTHTHTNNFSIGSGGAHSHEVNNDNWSAFQDDGGLPEPSTAGRLVVGSGFNEKAEKLESLAHADNINYTSSTSGHSHTLNGGINTTSNLPPYQVVNIWKRIA